MNRVSSHLISACFSFSLFLSFTRNCSRPEHCCLHGCRCGYYQKKKGGKIAAERGVLPIFALTGKQDSSFKNSPRVKLAKILLQPVSSCVPKNMGVSRSALMDIKRSDATIIEDRSKGCGCFTTVLAWAGSQHDNGRTLTVGHGTRHEMLEG